MPRPTTKYPEVLVPPPTGDMNVPRFAGAVGRALRRANKPDVDIVLATNELRGAGSLDEALTAARKWVSIMDEEG